jgi:hypothetical protein
MKTKLYNKIIVTTATTKSPLQGKTSNRPPNKKQFPFLTKSFYTILFVLISCAVGLGQAVTIYDRATWTVTASSEELIGEAPNGPASKLIDGNTSTYWSSKYNPANFPFPHSLVFDMKVAQPVNQISYVQKNAYGTRAIKGTVAFSADGINFGAETAITFNTSSVLSFITLPTTYNQQFFRITITQNEVQRDNPAETDPVTYMAELGAAFDTGLQSTLTSFTTQAVGATVLLQWTTSAEANAGFYTVKRSPDGLNGFVTIGLPVVVLPSNSATNYTFTDLFPITRNDGETSTSFYRIELSSVVIPPTPAVPMQTSRLAYAEHPLVTYSSTKPKNLNIFYFIPSDLAAPDDFKNRMDDIMVGLQTYFKDEMIRNGRTANSTFGMFTSADHTKVKLHVINGKLTSTGYPRGDSAPIMTEVKEYMAALLAANPSTQYGDHNLIMLPAYAINYNPSPMDPEYNPDGIFTQGPFYGNGKDCFAMDYDQLKYSNIAPDKQGTRDGRNSVKFIGGLAHEIAHGLNVPHNILKVSETPTLGTALMSDGNYTFGKQTTSVTAADAAILNRNQIFNNDGNTVSYYGASKASISSVSACYNAAKGAIIITGIVTTNGSPVTDVSVYNDPAVSFNYLPSGVGNNLDYDAVTWTTAVTNSVTVGSTTTARFYIEEPIAELQTKSNSMYEMKFNLIQLDGNTSFFKYRYDFGATEPVMSYVVYAPSSGDATGPTLTLVSATITASAGTNGTISQSGAVVFDCAPNVTYTITPASGFVIDKLLVDGVETEVTGGAGLRTFATAAISTYTFTNVVVSHNITVTFKSDPLPVNLVAFNVELKQKNNAFITWTTTEESNNAGFDVEMSTDARKFLTVGYVEGNGDSKQLKTYSYSVSDLSGGIYFFRLKQLDYDGKFEYSRIKALKVENADDLVSVFPNPTTDKIKLNASIYKKQAFSIEVSNQSGQIVLALPASASYTNGYELDATKFATGLYFIILKGAGFTERLKFVKL